MSSTFTTSQTEKLLEACWTLYSYQLVYFYCFCKQMLGKNEQAQCKSSSKTSQHYEDESVAVLGPSFVR